MISTPKVVAFPKLPTVLNRGYHNITGEMVSDSGVPTRNSCARCIYDVARREVHMSVWSAYRTNEFTVSNIENNFTDKLLFKEPQNGRNEVQPQGLHLAAV